MKVIDLLRKRQEWLRNLAENKRQTLQSAPHGRLTIDATKRKPQYYRVDAGGTARYISKKDFALIRALAQKDYDKRILETSMLEADEIRKFISRYPNITAEQIYNNLRPERQALVTPIIENDVNGVGAEYHYEKALYLEGWGTVYPDFTILNVRTGKVYFWEHLGKTDDPEYVQKNIRKIEAYAKNGFYPGEKLILSSETVDPLTGEIRIDTKLIKQLVRKYCC